MIQFWWISLHPHLIHSFIPCKPNGSERQQGTTQTQPNWSPIGSSSASQTGLGYTVYSHSLFLSLWETITKSSSKSYEIDRNIQLYPCLRTMLTLLPLEKFSSKETGAYVQYTE